VEQGVSVISTDRTESSTKFPTSLQ
jgi:hypothetical protein